MAPARQRPDKVPACVSAPSRSRQTSIAFTTGILIGIGETMEERIDSSSPFERSTKNTATSGSHHPEFPRQARIPMATHPEHPSRHAAHHSLARLILGPQMNIQAPQILAMTISPLLEAGINDWGGISPLTKDFINPEAPAPNPRLQSETESRGFILRERLASTPNSSLAKTSSPACPRGKRIFCP